MVLARWNLIYTLAVIIVSAQPLDKERTNTDNAVVAGKTLREWLRETLVWRRDPDKRKDVAEAIREADRKLHPLLKEYLSRRGDVAAPEDKKDVSRASAVLATKILGEQGSWLTADLLSILRGRGWKGRDYTVRALAFVSPNNPTGYSIAVEDLTSDKLDTRVEAVLFLATMRGSNEAIRLLIAASDDPSQKVRAYAIEGMGNFVWEQSVAKKLNEIAKDRSRSAEDGFRAEIALNPDRIKANAIVISPESAPKQ